MDGVYVVFIAMSFSAFPNYCVGCAEIILFFFCSTLRYFQVFILSLFFCTKPHQASSWIKPYFFIQAPFTRGEWYWGDYISCAHRQISARSVLRNEIAVLFASSSHVANLSEVFCFFSAEIRYFGSVSCRKRRHKHQNTFGQTPSTFHCQSRGIDSIRAFGPGTSAPLSRV